MNGIHDCGGMEDLGPILPEAEGGPVFKKAWEGRIFGLLWAVGAHGFWTIDHNRATMEKMGVVDYLTTPYYEHWLFAVETLLVEKGVIKKSELEKKRDDVRTLKPQG